MRPIFLVLALLGLATSCAEPQAHEQVVTSTCNCEIKPLGQRNTTVWYSVSNFNPKNRDCFKELRELAKALSYNMPSYYQIHFFDNLPNWKIPEDVHSNYGGADVMDKEILFFNRINGNDFYIFDNGKTGKYIEIKE